MKVIYKGNFVKLNGFADDTIFVTKDYPQCIFKQCKFKYLLREINVIKKVLGHENFYDFIDVFYNLYDPEPIGMVMPKYAVTLTALTHNNKLSEKITIYYYNQLINGINHMHINGISHNDIKPDNVMVTENHVIKIIDFDLCTIISSTCKSYYKTFAGTTIFASYDLLMGVFPMYRSDLATIIYTMLYCYKDWIFFGFNMLKAKENHHKYPQRFCKVYDIPHSLVNAFCYILSLQYDSLPDYDKCMVAQI